MHLVSCAVVITILIGSCSCDVLVYTQKTNQVMGESKFPLSFISSRINFVKVIGSVILTFSFADNWGVPIACRALRPKFAAEWPESSRRWSWTAWRMFTHRRSSESQLLSSWSHPEVRRCDRSRNVLFCRWYLQKRREVNCNTKLIVLQIKFGTLKMRASMLLSYTTKIQTNWK